VLIAVGIEIGSGFSSRIAINLNQAFFKQLFGVMLILCGIYFGLEMLL
jgi:uncharacterized membrane protein YfcA